MESVLFSDQMGRDLRWTQFLNTSLGRLHQAIPFDELARLFPPPSHTGRPAWMDVRGGIGLQVLKSYLGLSDEKLLDRLNTDWVLQYFCGIRLSPGQWIRDKDLVGRWRRYLSEHIDYAPFQLELAKHWKPLMKDTQAILMDATCYESHLRYPTDVKLLWECCEWLWELIDQCCKELKLAKPRRKQKKQFQRYLHYQKRRRKTHKKEKRQRRYLLRFLAKGLDEWAKLAGRTQIVLAQKTYDRLQTIRLVYEQQQLHYDDPQAQIKDRIVSLAKTYIRPIVRGKETKRVEFGAKVHSVQIDGITFVEHLSYDAFNEGTRLESSVTLSQTYFERCRQLGADRIYQTNANRRFCAIKGITTNFKPKGPKPKHKRPRDQMREALNKARASAMEGSFGNEKLHYNAHRIKAKTQATETLWIYMAIWTASAQKIAHRITKEKRRRQAA